MTSASSQGTSRAVGAKAGIRWRIPSVRPSNTSFGDVLEMRTLRIHEQSLLVGRGDVELTPPVT
jgi:hypothetical protein